jgi:methylenetetrahydrofolate--tRNA-(uracil-5-)-methyltransferase
MHRNSFINSPRILNKNLSLKENGNIFFAGQLSGVEGYMESAASGIIAGLNAVARLNETEPVVLPNFTMIGALLGYITDESVVNFQPMGANFGILPPLDQKIRDKKLRYAALSERSVAWFENNSF